MSVLPIPTGSSTRPTRVDAPRNPGRDNALSAGDRGNHDVGRLRAHGARHRAQSGGSAAAGHQENVKVEVVVDPVSATTTGPPPLVPVATGPASLPTVITL